MSPILVASTAGVLTLVLWGGSDWLASRSSKKFSTRDVNVAMQIVGMVVMAIVWGVSRTPLGSLSQILIMILAAVFFTAAYLLFIKGLALGKAGVVVPIANAYPVVTMILLFVFVTVAFTRLQIWALAVIIIGSILLGVETLNWRKLHKSFGRGVAYGLAAAILWGVGFFFIYFLIDKLAWQSIDFVGAETQGVLAIIIVLVAEKGESVKAFKNIWQNKSGVLSGVLLTSGGIAFYVGATSSKNILVPAVIASAAPLVTAMLSAVFDHERMILLKRIGALMVICGVVILNFH